MPGVSLNISDVYKTFFKVRHGSTTYKPAFNKSSTYFYLFLFDVDKTCTQSCSQEYFMACHYKITRKLLGQ